MKTKVEPNIVKCKGKNENAIIGVDCDFQFFTEFP